MKAPMKRSLLCILFIALESVLFGSQVSERKLIDEKQVRAMILQSAQAIQDLDRLIESKEKEKIIPARTLQWYQAVLRNNIHEYEKARDQKISVMPYDSIVSKWNYYTLHDLSALEKLSYNNIMSTQCTITTLKNMSVVDQWKYFHENVKKPYIKNPAQFISYLEGKLADHKQILQDSVHANRSHTCAQFWLGVCAHHKNFIQQQQAILEKMSQDENELHHYRDEYEHINSELKELWYGDNYDASIDAWAQVTKKILQHTIIHDLHQDHKVLQHAVNEQIMAIGRAKVADRKHAKKERKLMAAEEQAMHKFLVDKKTQQELPSLEHHAHIEKQVCSQAILSTVDSQKLLDTLQQDRVEIENLVEDMLCTILVHDKEKCIKKQKNQAKKQRHKQAVKNKANQQLDNQLQVDQVCSQDQEQSDALLRSQIETVELACNQSLIPRSLEKSSAPYEAFLVDMQGAKLHDSENYGASIQSILKHYAYAVCDENMTDEKMKNFHLIIRQIFAFNQIIQAKNQHLSWYVSLDKKMYKKMSDRFVHLYDRYAQYDNEKSNVEVLKASFSMKCHYAKTELQALQDSLKKAKDKNDRESMRTILTEIVAKQKQLDQLELEYKGIDTIHKNIEVLHWMKMMHGSGGVLNIEQLSNDIDFCLWKDGNLSENFISTKIKQLHYAIDSQTAKVPEDKKHVIVINIIKDWLYDYFGYVQLSLEERQFLANQISEKIGDLAYAYKLGHIDTDHLEYSLHTSLDEYYRMNSTEYTQLQRNDVVQIQLTLMEYLASILSE